jgi:hypothetical protein
LPIVVAVVAANLTSGGMGEVGLPTLAHEHCGAGGHGVLLVCPMRFWRRRPGRRRVGVALEQDRDAAPTASPATHPVRG